MAVDQEHMPDNAQAIDEDAKASGRAARAAAGVEATYLMSVRDR
ncbi:MAG: hypothetical protein NVSMB25_05570 [Thermoleophilaceae bacterium]